MKLTQDELVMAREWIADCLGTWRDLDDAEQVDELTDVEIERGIERHYSGGVAEFKQNCIGV